MKKCLKMALFVLMISIEAVIDWFNANVVKRFFSAGCVGKIYSVSILVGSGDCDANCRHCGGRYLRKDSLSREEGTIKGLKSALALCHQYGGWAISFTSSGEPLLSPEALTKTLTEIHALEDKGIVFSFINLFTNGIKLVDPKVRNYYLPLWKKLGLTAVAVSLHDVDYETNRKVYNLPAGASFPRLEEMIKAIKDADLVPRITLLLHKGYCDNVKDYARNLDVLKGMGVRMVTSWPLCNPDGERNKYTPSRLNLFKIRFFLWSNCDRIFNQIWGGGVYNYKGLSARLTTYVSEHKPTNDFIRQLVLFQDVTVAYSWFQEGAFCLK